MKLAQHLQQGKLLHHDNGEENISVEENEHYRWLSFDQITQSVVSKRKPYKLTLPHQYAMMLPLRFTEPKRIIEFGLGAGNLSNFILHYLPESTMISVEKSALVIKFYQKYFKGKVSPTIKNTNAEQWLTLEQGNIDWYIIDVYEKGNNQLYLATTLKLMARLTPKSWLTINLANLSTSEIESTLSQLKNAVKKHQLAYFKIPHYQNIIVQIFPNIIKQKSTYSLPTYYEKRADKLWLHRCILSENRDINIVKIDQLNR